MAKRRSVTLEVPTRRRSGEFVAAVKRSRQLHRPWIAPPNSLSAYRAYLARIARDASLGFLVVTADDELAGFININEIVRGGFQSAYLGYGAFAPHHGEGYMSAGLERVVNRAFREHRLHRLEANIQPENRASLALVRALGFAREGFSERYLKVAGRWRDHERWAITAEVWRRRPAAGRELRTTRA